MSRKLPSCSGMWTLVPFLLILWKAYGQKMRLPESIEAYSLTSAVSFLYVWCKWSSMVVTPPFKQPLG
jgi:hypothetical protein